MQIQLFMLDLLCFVLWPLADSPSEVIRTLVTNRASSVPNRKNLKLFIWYDSIDNSAEKHFGLLLKGRLIFIISCLHLFLLHGRERLGDSHLSSGFSKNIEDDNCKDLFTWSIRVTLECSLTCFLSNCLRLQFPNAAKIGIFKLLASYSWLVIGTKIRRHHPDFSL